MVAKRKRAPGGGRKRFGQSVAQNLTIRIDDDLRDQLVVTATERAKRNSRWNLSQEILLRLRQSLGKEQEERRNPFIRDACLLIARIAEDLARGQQQWHRNPFIFEAFKLAVMQLFDEIQPSGEGRAETKSITESIFETPEKAAAGTMISVLYDLHDTEPPPSWDDIRRGEWDLVNAYRRRTFAERMRIRRNLEIDKPKGGQK
jgi:hypothetical protein